MDKDKTIEAQKEIIADQNKKIEGLQQERDDGNRQNERLTNIVWLSGAVIVVLLLFLLFSPFRQR